MPNSPTASDLEAIPGYREVFPIQASRMSRVFYAEEKQTGELVVIKQLPEDADEIAKASLLAEAQIQNLIDHPQVTKIREDNSDHFTPHIVMEPVLGRRNIPNFANFCMPETASRLLYSMLASVVEVHENDFVFRDLKPDNYIIQAPLRAVLTDFGAATPRPYSERVKSGEIEENSKEHIKAWEHYQRFGMMVTKSASIGTIDYMSPEQLGNGRVDISSDIYSLGISYYQMLAGRLPYEVTEEEMKDLIVMEYAEPGHSIFDENISQEEAKKRISAKEIARRHKEEPIDLDLLLERGIPSDIVSIVERATKKDSKDRYKSAAEMKQDVEIALTRAGNLPMAA